MSYLFMGQGMAKGLGGSPTHKPSLDSNDQQQKVIMETNNRLKKKIVDLIKAMNQLQDDKIQAEQDKEQLENQLNGQQNNSQSKGLNGSNSKAARFSTGKRSALTYSANLENNTSYSKQYSNDSPMYDEV